MRIVYLAERLAYLSLIMLIASAVTVRADLAHFRVGLLIFAASALFSLSAITLSALFSRRCKNKNDQKRLSRAAIIALPAISFMAFNILSGSNRPLIHNISTDLASPPSFIAAASLRKPGDNPLVYSKEVADIQRAAYPDLTGITTTLPLDRAQQLCVTTAQEMGWEIHYKQPGHIEATSRSFWFGFTDDIVIRLQETESGSKIDLRSVSRVGKGDLGANAERIMRFNTQLAQRLRTMQQP
ncbi:DUF1499 domain-containing protein [Spongiibacter marinus]|uniref:DUF1499 domain-containing protein n=1 Tax=Spongiibacter marinus TaxID=354246 RepID=UPI0004279CC6|nr:DUF1499 domain-containing protein [Spongiibacter marinus]